MGDYIKSIITVLTVCTLMCVLPMVSSTPSWQKAPQDTTVVAGQNVTLACHVRDLDGKNVVWQKNGKDLLFFNRISHQGSPRYWITGDEEDGQFHLTIARAEKEDDAVYTCSVGHSTLSQDAQLTVIYAPSQPVISVSSQGQLVASQVVTLTCSSQGGNPAPSVRWYRDGRQISANTRTAPPRQKFGTTTGTLTWTLTKRDHGVEFSCAVENTGNRDNPRTTSRKLEVQYGPDVWFRPPGPLRVVQHEDLRLTCVVDANPAVTSVIWFRANTQILDTNVTIVIRRVDLSDNGSTYTCSANNGIGDQRASTSIQVLYPPSVKIRGTTDGKVYLREGSTANISCDVEAEPIADEVTWRKVGRSDVVARAHNLRLDKVDRSQAGVYVCAASNSLVPTAQPARTGHGNASVEIIVHYPPGVASIEQIPPGHVIVGQEVTLKCSSINIGHPSARYVWSRAGDKSWTYEGALLKWSAVKLQDSGVYACTPVNVVASGQTARRQITVNEEVTFLPPYLESVKYVKMSDRAMSVMCEVRGKPAPQVTWYKNGIAIGRQSDMFTVSSNQRPVDTHSYIVTSQLHWKGSGRMPSQDSMRTGDTGNYTCLASNSLTTERIQTLQLQVHYPPVVYTQFSRVGVDINETVSLGCSSNALPPPRFQWYRNNGQLYNTGHVTIEAYHNASDRFLYHSDLTIRDVTQRDLGVYKCIASNELASTSIETRVLVKDVPESPSNLTLHQVTWQSALIEWRPGFDGGYKQRFVVKFLSSAHSKRHLLVVPGHSTVFNVTGLYPATRYVMWVYGQNQLGGGAYSNSVSIKTPGYHIESITSATYNQNDGILSFVLPTSSQFCVHISISADNQQWQVYAPCAPSSGGSVKLSTSGAVNHARVSVCLRQRQDICSSPTSVKIVRESLTSSNMVAIIGGLCGAVLVILILSLVAIFLRRRNHTNRNKQVLSSDLKFKINEVKGHQNTTQNKSGQGYLHNSQGQGHLGTNQQQIFTGKQNNQHTTPTSLHQSFHRNTSHNSVGILHQPEPPGGGYSHVKLKNTAFEEHLNGGPQNLGGLHLVVAPSGDKNQNQNQSFNHSRGYPDRHSDNHSTGSTESGYSTPTKVKKIIHEIVV